jgi:hypothetical protein
MHVGGAASGAESEGRTRFWPLLESIHASSAHTISNHEPACRPGEFFASDRPDHGAGIRQALPAVSRMFRQCQGALRAGGVDRRPAGDARTHPVLRRSRQGNGRIPANRIRYMRGLDEACVAASQAALYRAADRPQAAGTGRNLFQFGVLPDDAPNLFSQRLHLRSPGDLHRVHRVRPSDLSLLLP